MKTISRILVAVDYSEPAAIAFDRALALSRMHGAQLTAVHAVATSEAFGARGHQRLALTTRLRREAESAGVPLRVSVQHGDPAGVVLLHARSGGADLIVLGSHQRTGLGRLRDGSIAERVARDARQPVLIVPARSTARKTLRSIVAAVDFGAAAEGAVARAVALAEKAGSRLTIVHVVPNPFSTNVPRYLHRFAAVEHWNLLTRDAWRHLQEIVLRYSTTDVSIHARVVGGDPPSGIARVAAETEADVIVLGVSRRGARARRVFGATAARVMRIASQPVLAVPEWAGAAVSSRDARTEPLAA
jgi:nucleotide-binding universal stress UspA family protein